MNPPDTMPMDGKPFLGFGVFEWERRPDEYSDPPEWRVVKIDDCMLESHSMEVSRFKEGWDDEEPLEFPMAECITSNPYTDYGIIEGWLPLPSEDKQKG